MQRLNVIFDSLDQLCLVLSDGTADVGSHKQSIEAREDAEHLIGITSSAQLVTQSSSDTCLNTVNTLIIPETPTSTQVCNATALQYR